MGSAQTPDNDLITRAKGRDPNAWAEMYERFSSQLYSFFLNQTRNREVAEDLTASVFFEAIRSAESFDGGVSAFRAWLFRIGRNNMIDHFRRERRAVMQDISTTDPEALSRAEGFHAEDPEEMAVASAEKAAVLAAIDKLAPDQREVMLLRLAGGLTSAEVAEVLGKTVGAVKQLQHRAVAALTKLLR